MRRPEPTPAETVVLEQLAVVDPELAYLALLTLWGIKPLSRWEKPLSVSTAADLAKLGLHTGRVRRLVKQGEIMEEVFSISPLLTRCYQDRFDGELVAASPDVIRTEGFLFGYPGCCIEAYVRSPYSRNDLDPGDQRILFHWGCPGCTVTPLLVPLYRRAHDHMARLSPGFASTAVTHR